MSQLSNGRWSWFKDHYEKVILLVLLMVLVASSAWLLQRVQSVSESTALSLTRLDLSGNAAILKDAKAFDRQFAEAVGVRSTNMPALSNLFISEMRVSCVDCGKPIPFDADSCYFCGTEQPPKDESAGRDTDGDGMPDFWELQYGLDPLDPTDADKDLDGDGFTNLEEFIGGTDPSDPESHPEPIVKLRVARIRPIPFYLQFVSVSRIADGSLLFQLNLQTQDKTFFAKLDEVIMGYQLTTFSPDAPAGETLRLVRVSDKRPIDLVRGRPVTEREIRATFVLLLNGSIVRDKLVNETFEIVGKTYKVVDIKRDSVVIQDVETATELTVQRVTPEETSALGKGASATAK